MNAAPIQLRPRQADAVLATVDDLYRGRLPIAVIGTGGDKSAVLNGISAEMEGRFLSWCIAVSWWTTFCGMGSASDNAQSLSDFCLRWCLLSVLMRGTDNG